MTIKALGKAILGVAAVSLWGLAPGCGPSIGSYCNKLCDCFGCSDSEHDECIDAAEDAKKAADEAGCGSEFNDALGCTNDEFTCDDGEADLDGCESEGEALLKCTSGSGINPGGLDPCEKYLQTFEARYEECGVDSPAGEIGECTDEIAAQAACLEPCVDLLPCQCIDGSGNCSSSDTDSYINCSSDCL